MNELLLELPKIGVVSLFMFGAIAIVFTMGFFVIFKCLSLLKINKIIESILRGLLQYMIYACMVIINYTICYVFVFTVCKFIKIHHEILYHYYAFGIMLGCIVVSLSPLAELIYSVFCTRKLSQRELKKVEHIIAEVFGRSKLNGLKIRNISIRVLTGKATNQINAYAVGKSTVVLTKRFLDKVDPYLMHGVIAHELGHLRYGDAKQHLFIFSLNLLTLLMFYVSVVLQVILKIVSYIPFVNLVSSVIGLFIFINFWILAKYKYILEYALMSLSRMDEFRADAFAKKLGYGISLSRYLDIYVENGSIGLLDTHPCTELRIDALA